ncbi:MAG: response regulator transcription factor [Chitinophagales bacterium]|nr:response regulator transcription factor [Chitinophagales bacterium]
MKVVIIDDEAKARKLLSTILQDFCEGITEILEAENLPKGVEIIKAEEPQLVFLDIEMPEYNGTQIFDFFEAEEINFKIVFTTAYSDFAIKAFEMNAVDYLLKPMRPNKVKEAVAKVKQQLKNQDFSNQIKELKLSFQSAMFDKIGLPVSDGILFVKLDEIIVMEADGMYTKVYIENGRSHVISKPLKYFVDILKNNNVFYRPHRSYFINIKHIKQFVRKDGNYIVMSNDIIVSISKDKRDEFLEIVNSI